MKMSWSSSLIASIINGNTDKNPAVAIDETGNAVIVWQNATDSVRSEIVGIARTASGRISNIQLRFSTTNGKNPHVAINSGRIVIVYESRRTIEAATCPDINADTLVFTQHTISLHGASTIAKNPKVTINSQGIAAAVWELRNPQRGTSVIQFSLYIPNEGFWLPLSNLSSSSDYATLPQVVLNSLTQIIVVWQTINTIETRSSAGVLAAFRFRPIQRLSRRSTNEKARNPQIALNSAGQAFVVWALDTPSQHTRVDIEGISYKFTSEGDDWSEIYSLSRGDEANSPQVSINSTGSVVVAWGKKLRTTYQIQAIGYTFNQSFTDIQVIASSNHISSNNSVSISDLGNVVWLWQQYNGITYVIESTSASFDSGMFSQTKPLTILSDLKHNNVFPKLAVNSSGYGVSAWEGPADAILYAIYTPVGGVTPEINASQPIINFIDPNQGPLSGGTTVTISGTGFVDVTGLTFGGISALNVVVKDQYTITATTPPPLTEVVNVVVTTSTGVSNAVPYTYFNSPPIITSMTPNKGPAMVIGDGTNVTLRGQYFVGVTSVTFGGISSTFILESPDTIVATSPPNSKGKVDVVVTSGYGPSNSKTFKYLRRLPEPLIEELDPSTGSLDDDEVVITGNYFTPSTTIRFGVIKAKIVSIESTSAIVIPPEGLLGTVDVTASNGRWNDRSNRLEYTYPLTKPVITSINANMSPDGGGNEVKISGLYFTKRSEVKFGDEYISHVTYVSPTLLIITAPPRLSSKVVKLYVKTKFGKSRSHRYKYIADDYMPYNFYGEVEGDRLVLRWDGTQDYKYSYQVYSGKKLIEIIRASHKHKLTVKYSEEYKIRLIKGEYESDFVHYH
jgi:hypothetical protein